MASLSLSILVGDQREPHKQDFDPSTMVFDACKMLRDRIQQANFASRKYHNYVY